MDEDKIRRMLTDVLGEFIANADDATNGDHPYWDDAIVEAMADAVMAVLRATYHAEQTAYQAG